MLDPTLWSLLLAPAAGVVEVVPVCAFVGVAALEPVWGFMVVAAGVEVAPAGEVVEVLGEEADGGVVSG